MRTNQSTHHAETGVRLQRPASWGGRTSPGSFAHTLLAVLLLVSAGLGRLGLTPLGWKEWFLLAVGLSQIPLPAAAFTALWLVVLGWRARAPQEEPQIGRAHV